MSTMDDVLEKLKELEQRIESLEKHVLNLLSDMIERKVGK
jgi:hypothetical protein